MLLYICNQKKGEMIMSASAVVGTLAILAISGAISGAICGKLCARYMYHKFKK
jgi:hypothetical protein